MICGQENPRRSDLALVEPVRCRGVGQGAHSTIEVWRIEIIFAGNPD
jgi:hypothetical protein